MGELENIRKMKINKSWLAVVFRAALSFILLFATVGIASVMMRPKELPKNNGPKNSINSVEAVRVERHDEGLNFKVDGEVIPFRNINIVPEISGRVIRKSENCRPGKSVRAGELLLEIDPTDFELTVREMTEALTTAAANVTENDVQLENTKKELEIAKKQLEIREREVGRYESSTLPGVYSRAEFDTVNTSLLTTRESVQQLENQVTLCAAQKERLESQRRSAEVNLDTAKLNLSRTKIVSPISGVVTSDTFEVNSYLQKGTSVAEILDTSRLEIQCSLQMKQIKWIWLSDPGDCGETANKLDDASDTTPLGGYVFCPTPVTILYDLEGDVWSWEGTLQTLDGSGINAATRMVPCRVTVEKPQDVELLAERIGPPPKDENPEDAANRPPIENPASPTVPPPTLFAGMYVSIVVHAKPRVTLFRVPEKALLPGNRVWTATGGVLHRHDLSVATTTPAGVIFYESPTGPFEDDLVVVSPLAAPMEGDKVHLMEDTPAEKEGEKTAETEPPVLVSETSAAKVPPVEKVSTPLSQTAPSNR